MPEELLHGPSFALRLYASAGCWLLMLAGIGLALVMMGRFPPDAGEEGRRP
jgi:hypothetical protein